MSIRTSEDGKDPPKCGQHRSSKPGLDKKKWPGPSLLPERDALWPWPPHATPLPPPQTVPSAGRQTQPSLPCVVLVRCLVMATGKVTKSHLQARVPPPIYQAAVISHNANAQQGRPASSPESL